VPDSTAHPTLDFQHAWGGAIGSLQVTGRHVTAETSYERERLLPIPMGNLQGWRLGDCDFDAVCVEFVATDDVWKVLLVPADKAFVNFALRRALGPPLPPTKGKLNRGLS